MTNEINCGAASGATSGGVGGVVDKTNCGAVDRATDGTASRTTGGATGGAIFGAASRVWTNVTIILINLSAYMSKLEKQSRQPGSSSFYNCSTNVIWNATFASRCF